MTSISMPCLPTADDDAARGWYDLPNGQRGYRVWNSARGIGDAVVGLYAACGFADSLPEGSEVKFQTHHNEWLDRCSHPKVQIVNENFGGADMGWGYHEQSVAMWKKTVKSRSHWYANIVGECFKLPRFEPSRPITIDKSVGMQRDHAYAIIAPFSDGDYKIWPIEKWNELAGLIRRRGLDSILVGGEGEWARSRSIRNASEILFGLSPRKVVEIILGASIIFGNDSGIPHVAGLYGVPFVPVMAHFDPVFTFGLAEGLNEAYPGEEVKCRGCGRIPGHGYDIKKCGSPCWALKGITAERVERIALSII